MTMEMIRLIGASSVEFPILGAEASGPFVLKSADGLGPPKVGVRMAKTVLEKAIYLGKSPDLRQIVCLVGLQPNWDVGQTPQELEPHGRAAQEVAGLFNFLSEQASMFTGKHERMKA